MSARSAELRRIVDESAIVGEDPEAFWALAMRMVTRRIAWHLARATVASMWLFLDRSRRADVAVVAPNSSSSTSVVSGAVTVNDPSAPTLRRQLSRTSAVDAAAEPSRPHGAVCVCGAGSASADAQRQARPSCAAGAGARCRRCGGRRARRRRRSCARCLRRCWGWSVWGSTTTSSRSGAIRCWRRG